MGTKTGALVVALSAAAAGGLAAATHALAPDRALALVLLVEALLVAIGAPLVAAIDLEGDLLPPRRGGGLAFAAFALVVVGVAWLRGAGASSALLGEVFLLLHGLAIFGLARAAGRRRGPGAGLAAGLGLGFLLLGAPYFAGDALAALPRPLEEKAVGVLVYSSPSLVLPGTFADLDVLHESVLYRRFTPVQDFVWSYPSPLAALGVQALFAALALGASSLAARLPRRAPAVLVGLSLLFLSSSRADAQILGGGEPATTGEGEIGPMNTRVRLGYLVPFIDGNFKVTGFTPDHFPSRIDLVHDLNLQVQYATPMFEMDVGWQGAGRVWVEYWEAYYRGDFLSQPFQGVTFRNLVVPIDDVGILDYRFRTIALNGRLDIPVLDWLTLEIIATTRYAHWETRIRDSRSGLKDVSNLDVIFPCIGPGFDLFIVDKVYGYGSIEWLDISYGGGHQAIYHYREVHGGIRLELVDTAHVGIEYYMLEVGLNGPRHSFRQRVMGPKVWVEVSF